MLALDPRNVDQLLVGCLLPELSQSILRPPEYHKPVNQGKPPRCKSTTHHWTSIQQTLTILSCQSQNLKDTDKKPRNSMKGVKDSMKVVYVRLYEDLHQMLDNPSTFMTRMRESAANNPPVHDERRQALNPRVTWDGSIDRFEVFRNNVKGHYGQSGAGYLFDPDFQTAYLERGTDCFVNFLDEVPSASQIKKDKRALYGALLSAC
jgi:hypothetical protein